MGLRELETQAIRAQAGDVDAYTMIVLRFQNMAVGYAYSILWRWSPRRWLHPVSVLTRLRNCAI